MVDARILQAFSDGRINTTEYPHITPEYLAETRDPQAIAGIIFLLCLTTIVIVLRTVSRIFLVKSFGLDDYLALLGYVFFIVFTTLGIILIREGSGRHLEYIQYILTSQEVNQTEINDDVAHLIYTTALFVCRLSGLAFYYRLCTRHDALLKIIIGAAVFLVCCFLPQFCLILFHCSPVTGLWPYAWQPEVANYTCLNWGVVYVTNSSLSLVCDFVIFTIPLAIISIVKLSRERKIMLAFVLLPGVFVISISCVRLWLCVIGQWRADQSWAYDPQIAIEVAEIGGTIIALSVPGLKALIGTVYDRMRSTIDHTYPSTGRGKVTFTRGTADNKNGQGNEDQLPRFVPGSLHKAATKARISSRGSDSDDDLLASMGSRDIFVQRDVDIRMSGDTTAVDIPMARLKQQPYTADDFR